MRDKDDFYREEEERRRREREKKKRDEELLYSGGASMQTLAVSHEINQAARDTKNINKKIDEVNSLANDIFAKEDGISKGEALEKAATQLGKVGFIGDKDIIHEGTVERQNESQKVDQAVLDVKYKGIVQQSYESSDVHKGSQKFQSTMGTLANASGAGTFARFSANTSVRSTLERIGAENTGNLKNDFQNALKASNENLKNLSINYAALDKKDIDKILSSGRFKGKVLSKEQLSALSTHQELLKAQDTFHVGQKGGILKQGANFIVKQSENAEAIQGAKNLKMGLSMAGKGINNAINIPTNVKKRYYIVKANSLGRDGREYAKRAEELNEWSNKSLLGKASTPFKKAGTGIKNAAKNKINQTEIGRKFTSDLAQTKADIKTTNDAKKELKAAISRSFQNTGIGRALSRIGDKIGKISDALHFKKKLKGALAKAAVYGLIFSLAIYFVQYGFTAAGLVIACFFDVSAGEDIEGKKTILQTAIDEMYANQRAFVEILKYGKVESKGLPDSVDWSIDTDNITGTLTTYEDENTYTYKKLSGKELLSDEYLGMDDALDGFVNAKPMTVTYTGKEKRTITTYGESTYKNIWEFTSGQMRYQVDAVYTSLVQSQSIYDKGTVEHIYKLSGEVLDHKNLKVDKPQYVYFKIGDNIYGGEYNKDGTWTEGSIIYYKKYTNTIREDTEAVKGAGMKNKVQEIKGPASTEEKEFKSTVYAPAGSTGLDDNGNIQIVENESTIESNNVKKPKVSVEYEFVDENMQLIKMDEIYRMIISIATAGTHNTDGDVQYYVAYCNYLFNSMMKHSCLDVQVKLAPSTEKFRWGVKGYIANDSQVYFSNSLKTENISIKVTTKASFNKMLETANELDAKWHERAMSYITKKELAITNNMGEEILEDSLFQMGYLNNSISKYVKTQEIPTGDEPNLTENGEYACELYLENEWDEYKLTFPGGCAQKLDSARITSYIAEITENYKKEHNGEPLSDDRIELLKIAFSMVGSCPYQMPGSYNYKNPAASQSTDCSGYISICMALYLDKALSDSHNGLSPIKCTTSDLFNLGKAVANENDLQPGDIIVHVEGLSYEDYKKYGGNYQRHVVMYAGKFSVDGGKPVDHFVEATTSKTSSGPQITQRNDWMKYPFTKSNYYHARNIMEFLGTKGDSNE